MSVLGLAAGHATRQAGVARATVAAVLALWDAAPFTGAGPAVDRAAGLLAAGQFAAASLAADYLAAQAAAQGGAAGPGIDPRAFAGVTAAGDPLDALLRVPAARAWREVAAGRLAADADAAARARLVMMVGNETSAAGVAAAAVGVTCDPQFAGYVRAVTAPACPRCVILAGRRYTAAEAFARHPRCDCVHVPLRDLDDAAPVERGPDAYFAGLSPREQDRWLGVENAQAVRDGADLISVVNVSQRGAGLVELQGYQREGREYVAVRHKRGRDKQHAASVVRRATPAQIYARAGGDRDAAVDLLFRNGYLRGGRAIL